MPKINQEEYEVLKGLDDKWKWIARDKDGEAFIYEYKPYRIATLWNFDDGVHNPLRHEDLFQFIQWEDDEPHNIAELIEEYESEETEVKNIEWLKGRFRGRKIFKTQNDREIGYNMAIDEFSEYVDQLDEPEVLSDKWIDEHKYFAKEKIGEDAVVKARDLRNLLVPKQEEIDQAYKDGYEKGKQHTFYKGYLEGLADKENEPETVADVVTTFWKSFERLKEVMSMEVEELEE